MIHNNIIYQFILSLNYLNTSCTRKHTWIVVRPQVQASKSNQGYLDDEYKEMYPVPIWMSFGGEAPNNDRQRCTAPKTSLLGGLHVLHSVTLFIGFKSWQSSWWFGFGVCLWVRVACLGLILSLITDHGWSDEFESSTSFSFFFFPTIFPKPMTFHCLLELLLCVFYSNKEMIIYN